MLPPGLILVYDGWEFGRVLSYETSLSNNNFGRANFVDTFANGILSRLRMLAVDLSHVLVKYSVLIRGTLSSSKPPAHCIGGVFVHSIG